MSLPFAQNYLCSWLHTLPANERAALKAIRIHYLSGCQTQTRRAFRRIMNKTTADAAVIAVDHMVQALLQGYRSVPNIQSQRSWRISSDEKRLLRCLRALQQNQTCYLNSTVDWFVVNAFGAAFANSVQHLARLLAASEQHLLTHLPPQPNLIPHLTGH